MTARLSVAILARLARCFPGTTARALKLAGRTTRRETRYLRTIALREQSRRLAQVMADLGFRQNVLVDADGEVHVESHGILLNVKGTNRYFKGLGESGNEGHKLGEFLESHGIRTGTMLDIGANFGEIALYFARRYPDARIVAVEPAPENLAILKGNLGRQYFDTGHVQLVPEAVSARRGHVTITQGLGSENSIVSNRDNTPLTSATDGVEVPCTTLAEIVERCGLAEIDFIKIDIEGAEPLLSESLVKLAGCVRSLYIEFSSKNSEESYLELLRALMDAGYRAFVMENPDEDLSFARARDLYLAERRDHGGGVNFWFLGTMQQQAVRSGDLQDR
ncbi:MAG: FkbM family methyltransferase [Candidatus Eisenbacteria sp.]|nr:FkbM family methyltransferase [Candidatus Eisenbacteria bacterium]